MYKAYYGFDSKPFDLLPNPDFLFPSKAHKKALTYLGYGIQERSGFILLTGEIGSGKTTIIRDLLKRQLSRVKLAKVFNTKADSHQLISMINDDYGLETAGKDKITLLRELNDFLIEQFAAGNRCVLIIDEAQNLTIDLLEEVRMLSNLETDAGKLLQIILVGQPELRQTLNSHELLQLRQRIQVFCHIDPLGPAEVEEYVLYRMARAGNREALKFEDGCFEVIHAQTRGIPRLINILMDYILLDGFVSERRDVSRETVLEIVADLDFEKQFWATDAPPAKVSAEFAEGADEALPEPSGARGNGARAGKLAVLMREMSRRLDRLEEENFKLGQAGFSELNERIATLERQGSAQRQQYDAAQAHLRGQVAQLQAQLQALHQNQLQAQSAGMPNSFAPAAAGGVGRPGEPDAEHRERGWFRELLFGSD